MAWGIHLVQTRSVGGTQAVQSSVVTRSHSSNIASATVSEPRVAPLTRSVRPAGQNPSRAEPSVSAGVRNVALWPPAIDQSARNPISPSLMPNSRGGGSACSSPVGGSDAGYRQLNRRAASMVAEAVGCQGLGSS